MLQKIVLSCSYAGGEKVSYNWGSIMYGVLTELLSSGDVSLFRENKFKPYSQYVIPKTDRELEWHVGILDNNISNVMTKIILPLTQINLKHKGIVLNVTSVNRKIKSKQDFLRGHLSNKNPPRRYKIEFLTPCSHNSKDNYAYFPTPRLIFEDLLARFSEFSGENSFKDKGVLSQLEEYVKVSYYTLRTVTYRLKETKVIGYNGNMILDIWGSEQLARLSGMLLAFTEYAGMGINTSWGMGGCSLTQERMKQKISG